MAEAGVAVHGGTILHSTDTLSSAQQGLALVRGRNDALESINLWGSSHHT